MRGLKYNGVVFRVMLFAIVFVFGSLISGLNWLLGFVCAIIISFLYEIGQAYDKGKEDGRKEVSDRK